MCSAQALGPLLAQSQSLSYRRALLHRDAAQHSLAGPCACTETQFLARILAAGGLDVLAQAKDHLEALAMLLALAVYARGFTH